MAVQSPGYVQSETVAIVETGPTVSWGAVIAGAVAAAGISFILLAVGTAFGLSVVSPWDSGDAAADAAAAVGIGAVIYLLLVHGISSGFGGYLAGRLRRKLVGARGDETYFRDTAHGLLVWALSAVVGVGLLAMLSAKIIGGGLALGTAGLAGGGALAGGAFSQAAPAGGMENQRSGGATDGPMRELESYYVDALFRPSNAAMPAGAPATGDGAAGSEPTGTGTTGSTTTTAPITGSATVNESGARSEELRREVSRILRVGVLNGEVTSGDKAYVAQLVAQETGMPQADASRRVDEVIGQSKAAAERFETAARDAAEAARQASRAAAIWSAVTLLVGAFAASFCATWGGRARDNY
jgi:hypothetical protein